MTAREWRQTARDTWVGLPWPPVKLLKCLFPALTMLAALPVMAATTQPPGSARDDEPADRVIVKWRDVDPGSPVDESHVRGLAGRVSQKLVAGHSIGGRMSVVRLDRARSGAELRTMLAALRADPAVEDVMPDRRVKALAYTPNDPLYAGQWYLKSAQPAAIRAESAWDITRGGATPDSSPVIVAVIDTGVRMDHPDLVGKVIPGYDFVSTVDMAGDGDGWDADPSDPGDFLTAQDLTKDTFKNGKCGGGTNYDQPTSSSWHGTRVTGMIAANTDNAVGIAGTGFNIRVLAVRALGKCGGFDSDVLAAMYWAAGLSPPAPLLLDPNIPLNTHPAQVINMSLGSSGSCSSLYATAVSDITSHGVLIVASAGNDGTDVGEPANCPGVLAVAGLRHAGTKVGYSDLGTTVGISAPAGNCVNTTGGPCVYSLDTTTNDGATTPGNNIYTDKTLRPSYGTSFASPQAAGTAGLMKAANPGLTPAKLIARIQSSARTFPTVSDTSPQPAVCQLPANATAPQLAECICTTQVCGAGMLDASGAVAEAERPIALAQVNGVVGTGRTLTLDGSQSTAATGIGRSVASYAWTLVSVNGGAGTPSIQNAMQSVASVLSPTQGNLVLRLTVTDNMGAIDTADVTITAASGGATTTSSSPPPSMGGSSGGGGSLSLSLLLLVAVMTLLRLRRRGMIPAA